MTSLLGEVQALATGRYIVAVSGGVDSMVLLHMLLQLPHLQLVVVHVNHGIRTDAERDEALVAAFCASHNIKYVATRLNLGPRVSEADARYARYAFLQHCRIEYNAVAIITAHHQNDVCETALLNVMRGTSWRGIAPFVTNEQLKRPLVNVPKDALVAYAQYHKVPWREDSTNAQSDYTRNYIRNIIMPIFNAKSLSWQTIFLRQVRNQRALRRKIEAELSKALTLLTRTQKHRIFAKRYDWIMLPETVRYELFQTLCRHHINGSLTQAQAAAACVFIRTARAGKYMPLNKMWQLRVTRQEFVVELAFGMVK